MSGLKFESTHPKASCPNILGKMPGKSCKNKSESKERTHTCKAVHMWLYSEDQRSGSSNKDKDADLHAPERDVAVAERGADDPYPELVRLGRVDDDLLDGERLAGAPAHGRCASQAGKETA
jgi:hypothetical protein